MKIPPGWVLGYCWHGGCHGRCAWPPNTVTATVKCDGYSAHVGVVYATGTTPESART